MWLYYGNLLQDSRAPGSRPAYLQGELVDGVDLVQVVEYEVEQGGARGCRPVQLAGLVYLNRRLAALYHLQVAHRHQQSDRSS